MRQEPKIYESTKPKDAVVDTDVVAAHIADDGFHDMVNKLFQKIYTFLKWNFSADSSDSDHHNVNGFSDEYYRYDYDYEYGYGTGYPDDLHFNHWHSQSDDN